MSSASDALLDRLAQRWWFFFILLLLLFSPAYTSQPFNPAETPKLVIEVLSRPFAYSFPAVFPIFKALVLALVAGLLFFPARVSRLFYAWAGFNLIVVAVFQDMAETLSFGFAVLTGNLIVYGLVGLLWLRAALGPNGSRLTLAQPRPGWRYWVGLPALLAYGYPVSTTAGIPAANFSPVGLLTNEAGLTFCMMLPVYLAVLTLGYPDVDHTVLRITAGIGVFTGLLNVIEFFLIPVYGPWMGTLHLPLLLISLYAFALSLRNRRAGHRRA
jgi:hypothetical protein